MSGLAQILLHPPSKSSTFCNFLTHFNTMIGSSVVDISGGILRLDIIHA